MHQLRLIRDPESMDPPYYKSPYSLETADPTEATDPPLTAEDPDATAGAADSLGVDKRAVNMTHIN